MGVVRDFYQKHHVFLSSYFFPARYCPTCKNDTSEVVKAGEKLKASKKKARMPSATTESQRDWGKVRA